MARVPENYSDMDPADFDKKVAEWGECTNDARDRRWRTNQSVKFNSLKAPKSQGDGKVKDQ